MITIRNKYGSIHHHLNKAETIALLEQMDDDDHFTSFDGAYEHNTGNPAITISVPKHLVPFVESAEDNLDRVLAGLDGGISPPAKPKLTIV